MEYALEHVKSDPLTYAVHRVDETSDGQRRLDRVVATFRTASNGTGMHVSFPEIGDSKKNSVYARSMVEAMRILKYGRICAETARLLAETDACGCRSSDAYHTVKLSLDEEWARRLEWYAWRRSYTPRAAALSAFRVGLQRCMTLTAAPDEAAPNLDADAERELSNVDQA